MRVRTSACALCAVLGVLALACTTTTKLTQGGADVRVAKGEEVQLEPIVLSLGAILSGQVVDASGNGVAGADLLQLDQDGGMFFFGGANRRVLATTDANGVFRIDELACGAWRLGWASRNGSNGAAPAIKRRFWTPTGTRISSPWRAGLPTTATGTGFPTF